MLGIYGVNAVELKDKERKKDGYIWGADSRPLGRLLEILEFFDVWQYSLQAAFDGQEWKKHFITDLSWFDMRCAILGFVAMSRYVFADEDLVKGRNGKGTRFLYPRMFSQVRQLSFAHFCVCFACLTPVHLHALTFAITTRPPWKCASVTA